MFLAHYFLKFIPGVVWVLECAGLPLRGPCDSEWGGEDRNLPVEQAPWVDKPTEV